MGVSVRTERKTARNGPRPFLTFGVAAARKIAQLHRENLGNGIDPITARDDAAAAAKAVREAAAKPTLGEYALKYIDAQTSQWRNLKHRAQWKSSLETHAASLWDLKIDMITKPAMLACLKPIWNVIPEAASRVQGRIKTILAAAIGEDLATGPNPANWEDALKPVLKSVKKLQRGHHAAMA